MTSTGKKLLLAALAGAGVFFLWRKRAMANVVATPAGPVVVEGPAEEPIAAPPPDAPPVAQTEAVAPRSEFPWMTYSFRTLQIQQVMNQWRATQGQPLISEDGILGPQTCRAWWAWWREDIYGIGSINPPSACNAYG